MIYNSKFNSIGFTLIEIIVAIALFSLVISITVGIFVTGSDSQRKTIELHKTQREAGYIMETITRELRMATAMCDNGKTECSARTDQQNNESSEIEFKNYDGNWITFCRSDINGLCATTGNFLSRNGNRVSSSDIIIEDLKFYTSESFNLTQPIVTIVIKVKSTGKYGTSIVLQNSISLRLYN